MARTAIIVGAGVAGLTAAYRLLQQGYNVQVFERSPFVGGQLVTTTVGGEPIECYYHHAFTSDTALWALCEELGIMDQVQWLPSTMGYYSQGKLYPFGTPKSLIGFSPLGFWGRLQFVVSALWLTHVASQAYTEGFGVKEWFEQKGFKKAWDVIWKPLFHLKFADSCDTISLTWLWGKFRTRGKSRKTGGAKEVLAYMKGSFGVLATTLAAKIAQLGGQIQLGQGVDRITPQPDGRFEVQVGSQTLMADVVISTVSSDLLAKSAPWSAKTQALLATYTYKAAMCMMLVSDRPWFDLYWINIGDTTLPFGGVIEHTHFVPATHYAGKHVVYLSRYLDENHPLFSAPEAEVVAQFMAGLKTLNPAFDEVQVSEIKLFRQRNAQPVVPKGYVPPSMATEFPHFYWISTHHTYPFDRGINFAIELAELCTKPL
ncbi:MAG: FAD-dependent oxidoreductase [Candidatus Margulisiibacteriota bacterium]